MTPQALKYAEEFLGVFAPAMPPHGWEALVAEMDAWTDKTLAKVDSLLTPKPIYGESILDGETRKHCQAWYEVPGSHGTADPCWRLASISDKDTSLSYCVRCWRNL